MPRYYVKRKQGSKTYTAAQKATYYQKKADFFKNKTIKKVAKTVIAEPMAPDDDYIPDDAPRLIKKIGGKGAYYRRGERVSRSMGEKIGGWVGGGLQKMFKALTGFGDYNVGQNTLMNGGMSPPEVVNTMGNGGFIVRHREYLQDITGTTAFTILNFFINPALGEQGLFLWLTNIASAFEQYEMRGLVVEFKSLASDYGTGTNGALGYVIMACEYNATLPNFPDKRTMENYQYAVSNKPSRDLYCPIECAKAQTPISMLYNRTGTFTGDQKFYDLGNFQIATGGQVSNGGVIGELWVTYEVALYKPKNVQSLGLQLLTDKWYLSPGSPTNSQPFGSAVASALLRAGSNLGTTLNSNGLLLQFPAALSDGVFFVSFMWRGASTACTAPAYTFTNCTALKVWINDNNTTNGTSNGNTTTDWAVYCWIQVTAQNATFKIDGSGTLPATPTAVELVITQVNGNIIT